MISSLAPCFTGTFLHYKDVLALPGEHASPISGSSLLEPGTMENLLARFAEHHRGGDRRALVSMWTQWHFGALIIPTTAATLFLNRDLPIGLDQVSLSLRDGGQTGAIIIPDDGAPRLAEKGERFSRLFQDHVEPLIRHLSGQFRVSPRMLWANAATIFEWTLQQAAATGQADPAALEEGHMLLQSKLGSSGVANPMFGLVQYLKQDDQTVMRRKVCCLRYLLPGVECCGGLCPLPPTKH